MYTVFSTFASVADAIPHRPFLCIPARDGRSYHPAGLELTYGQVAHRAEALAALYRQSGVGNGHRVCLVLENRPDFIVHWLALNSLGVSIVPINPAYRAAEIGFVISHAKPDLIVTLPHQAQLVSAVERAESSPPILEVRGDDLGASVTAIPAPKRRPRDEPAGRHTEAALLYTSGTTARPKGCQLSNEYFLSAGRWYASRGGEATYRFGTERLYSPLPLFHMAGLSLTTMAMMLTGGCLILPERFNARYAWQDMMNCRATALHYLGVIVAALLAHPVTAEEKRHTLRFSMGVGASPEQRDAASKRFGIPFTEGWGMTETGRSCFNTVEPRHPETNTIGRSEPGFELVVLDERGQEVPRGTLGELCARHSAEDPRRGFFSGYLGNPDETEHAWRHGWFHTGDTAWQHDDGAIVFVDRLKHLIRRAGENISAAEVEAVLNSSPLVGQAAVVAAHDAIRQEEVAAFVVLADGLQPSRDVAIDIFRFCADRLAQFKLPAWMAFVRELPLTSTNKIQKHSLLGPNKDPSHHPGIVDLRQDKIDVIKSNGTFK